MGWMALLDKNGKEIGVVGDEGWDMASEFVKDFCALYIKEFLRFPTFEELEQSVFFVYNGIDKE